MLPEYDRDLEGHGDALWAKGRFCPLKCFGAVSDRDSVIVVLLQKLGLLTLLSDQRDGSLVKGNEGFATQPIALIGD